MRYCFLSSARRSARRPVATMSRGSRQPDDRSPEMRASPILPAPRTAILGARRRPSAKSRTGDEPPGRAARPRAQKAGDVGVRAVDQPAAPPGEQVRTGKALPFAVRDEELRRLGGLDPASAQGGHQLDQAEIADQPVVPTAEAGEDDDATGPWTDRALTPQPRGHRGRRHVAQALEVQRPAEADERARPLGRQPERPQPSGREAREIGLCRATASLPRRGSAARVGAPGSTGSAGRRCRATARAPRSPPGAV